MCCSVSQYDEYCLWFFWHAGDVFIGVLFGVFVETSDTYPPVELCAYTGMCVHYMFWCFRRDVCCICRLNAHTSRIVRIHCNVCALSLHVATHGNTRQHTATHRSALQHTATQCVHIRQSNHVHTLQHARIESRDGATDATHAQKCHTATQCVHIHQSNRAHTLQHAHASHMFECTRPLGL